MADKKGTPLWKALILEHRLPWKYKSKIEDIVGVKVYGVKQNKISKKPTIYVGDWFYWIPAVPKNEKAYFIFFIICSTESEEKVEIVKKVYEGYKKRYPKHEFIFLCNTFKEYKLFGDFNIPRIFCNQNAFLDERVFRILPEKKIYDAVYNSRIIPLKRHELAKDIKRLALIFGMFNCNEEYIKMIKKKLINANWLNYDPNNKYNNMKKEEVSRCLNQSMVGLCLSAIEGAMYVSAEYLLCGLPVVSTRSMGGRDVFFDDKYVKIVDDTPEAVAEGVYEMIKRKIDPYYIRKKTIEKMKEHRERFIKLVQGIYDKEGVKRNFKEEFGKIFINKMYNIQQIKCRRISKPWPTIEKPKIKF